MPLSPPPHELELKLVPQSMASVTSVLDALYAQARVGPEILRRQRDEYLDTDSGQLATLGLAVRVRAKGDSRIMTAKVVPVVPKALADRAEWAAPIEVGADWDAAFRSLMQDVPLPPLDGPLTPFLRLATVRRAHAIQAQFEAELCIDEVQVQVGTAPIGQFREIELEFAGGDETAFRVLATQLGRLPGLEHTGVSKVDRARALAGLDTTRYGRPTPIYSADVPARDAIREIFVALWSRVVGHEGGARLGLDLEHVHKMRVALRRMRSGLGLFRKVVERSARKSLGKDLRRIASALGAVRDLDVQRAALPAWRARSEGISAEAWGDLEEQLQTRWGRAHRALLETLSGEHWLEMKGTMASRLEKLVAPETADVPIRSALALGLQARLERYARAAKRARKRPVPDRLHALRIEAKRVRYAIEFALPLEPVKLKRSRKRLAHLQEELGDFQDAVVARDMMKGVEGAAGQAVHEASARRAKQGEAELKEVLGALGLSAFLEEVGELIAPWLPPTPTKEPGPTPQT